MSLDLSSVIFLNFKVIFISLVMTLIVAWVCIQLARRIHLIDFPDSEPHKKHFQPTPMAGGATLAFTLLLSGWFLGIFDDLNVKATFLAGIPIFIFGIWDDYRHISPFAKLSGQVIAAIILIHTGVYIRIFESPEFFLHGEGMFYVYLDWLITILWVVGITNAYNFVDSMDGLAVGLGGMAAAFFMLVTLDAQQLTLSQYSALILGICIGLYFYNSPSALLFLGDSGSQTLGFILAVLAIGYSPQGAYQSSSWFVPILLLGIPIFDTALIVISRLRRGRPVYSAGQDHTYHRLRHLGLSASRSVLVMQIAALLLSCVAFLSLNQSPLIANLVFATTLLLGGWLLAFLDNRKLWI